MLLRYIFSNKIQAFIAVVVVVILLNVSVWSLFFNSSSEIIYDYENSVFLCLKSSALCGYSGEFKVANTGTKVLENVTVQNKGMPKNLKVAIKILDLNASSPREGEPKIVNSEEIINIDSFYPETLVIIQYSGSEPIEQREALASFRPEVVANAKLINADPQGTEFARFLSIFF